MYKKIQFLCKEKGTNITKLCEQVTGSSGNLSTWKKGYMRSDYLSKVADILECTTDYLLDRSDMPNLTNSISNTNTTVTGTQANIINGADQLDEMTAELVKAFRSLPFRDRLDVINMVMEKSGK